MSQAALPGFRDSYPQELAERAYLMRVWRDVARRFAFQEYDGPPLEPLELYTRKSGDEIIAQLYSFTDKGDRKVALRPEMTPTFARMVAAKVQALRKPVRWFSIPQLFRYERQQKGRLREHFQLNVDIVGEGDVSADAELLAVAIEVMRACGLGSGDVQARVSDRRIFQAYLAALGVPEAVLPIAMKVVDKVARQSRERSMAMLTESGVSAAVAQKVCDIPETDIAQVAAILGDSPARKHVGDLRRYIDEYLPALGIEPEWVRFDLSIVRGLDYYTGIVFELFDREREHRAICGGGRYDDLLSDFGAPDLPALGFGMGDVVLSEILRARGLMRAEVSSVDYWVACEDNDQFTALLRVAARLRSAGHSVEYALRRQPLAKQLRSADAVGARSVVILKRDRSSDALVVKRLSDGEEREMSLEELVTNH